MKLKKLLNIILKKGMTGIDDQEVTSIVTNSKKAGPGSLFVAVRGVHADGHDFLEEAYQAGARAFVTQKPFKRLDASNIVVPDSRIALSALSAEFYGQPSKRMALIGITGTNGKTTTAFLLESILKHAGFSVGLLSTVEYRFGSQIKNAMHTTPDPVNLQGILRDMHRQGTQYAVMEVSSHGMKQGRVENCHFDIGVFTNLTPEHLDYHGTMEDYAMSKERFFTELMPQSSKKNVAAVINQDDPAGRRFLEKICCRAITYGLESGDVHAEKHRLSLDGIKAQFVTPQGTIDISSKLVGTFNVYNLLAAVAASTALDMPPESIRAGIEKVRGIPGRMEQIENNKDILTFVDFAHTGDALENVLKTLRSIGAKTIITVFGCGGDRDRSKRPVMGRIAAMYSTVVIITSDNPRSENPDHIIQQIEGGIREQGFRKAEFGSDPQIREYVYFILPDRRTAIQKAVTMARPGDVVLIAGKGHETNQQKGNKTIHFDDREEAREALKMCA